MGETFAEKFEAALDEKRRELPGYGLRTLARKLADDDLKKAETIRRRLNKYRPKPGGGAAEVSPTVPTRREIEAAMGLPQDALAPDLDAVAASSEFETLFDALVARAIAKREARKERIAA